MNTQQSKDSVDKAVEELGWLVEKIIELADEAFCSPQKDGSMGKAIALSKLVDVSLTGDAKKDITILKVFESILQGKTVKVGRAAGLSPQQALATVAEEPGETIAPVPVDLIDAYEQFKRCVLAIADTCDGAIKEDGVGFNGTDAGFGKSIASRLQNDGSLSVRQLEAAYKMLGKYRKQLEAHGLTLPDRNELMADHNKLASNKVRSPKRLEIVGNAIHVYTTFDENHHFKPIGYVRFDPSTKAWIFAKNKAIALVEKAKQLGDYDVSLGVERLCQIEQEKIEQERIDQEQAALRAATELDRLIASTNLDQAIACGWSLFDHQKEAAKWLLAHGNTGVFGGGILADQMGLGKSISALVAAKSASQHHGCHIIVVCPAFLKDNWLIEAERVGVQIDVYSWAKIPSPPKSEGVKYILIADEAHYAQNPKSQRTKRIWDLARASNCLYAWLLTGTPLKNGRPINLYPLLYAVDHPLSGDRREYEKLYCNAAYRTVNSSGHKIWDNMGASHLDDLSRQTENVILQRKKEDCLDLPPKIRNYRAVELNGTVAKSYREEIDAIIQDYRDRAEAGEASKDAEALVVLGTMRRIGSKYKVDYAVETAIDLLDQGESVVMFTEFLESAHAIANELRSKGVKLELLDGSVPATDRQGMVDRFQAGESKVFIGTIRAGGVGITLTRSHYVVMVDRPWTPGDAEQAEDRCHRIGTTETVFPIWLQLGEIDTLVDALIEKKQARIDLVMGGKRKTLRGVGNITQLAKELINDMANK